jgi:hypothetical protein
MQIHVIAFDIPYPADYGGVIDVYYKIKALKDSGLQVNLHCFQYGKREQSDVLLGLCESVRYYKRSLSWVNQLSGLPFIVQSRNNSLLIENLCRDNYPILFEGIHTTCCIGDERLKDRTRLLRMHNIEWHYYANLALRESNIIRKSYLQLESLRLKRYEKKLQQQDIRILAISDADKSYFSESGFRTVSLLPAFHPFGGVHSKPGRGKFVLFHGNLSVADNRDAAVFLMEKVFADLPFPLVIAGKNPDGDLYNKAKKYGAKVEIVANPDEDKMRQLLGDAHAHVLWSFQPEGIKLKLYYALCEGRFVIANSKVAENSGMKQLLQIADSAGDVQELLKKAFAREFEMDEIAKRDAFLEKARSIQMELLKEIFQ